jgi:hypothetical protein
MVSRKKVGDREERKKRKEMTRIFRPVCVLNGFTFLALKRIVALRWVWEMKGNGRELWDQAERWGCLRPWGGGKSVQDSLFLEEQGGFPG